MIYLRMSRRALMEFLGASAHGLDWAIRIVCYFLRLIRQSTALACSFSLLLYNSQPFFFFFSFFLFLISAMATTSYVRISTVQCETIILGDAINPRASTSANPDFILLYLF